MARGGSRRCRPAMGTFVHVTIHDGGSATDDRALSAAFVSAFDAVDRVAALMSFHDPRSELSGLNASAHCAAMRVDPWTYEVLDLARRIFDASGGLFDCTVGADLVDRGLLPRPVAGQQVEPVDAGASFADVRLLGERAVAFRRPLRLDLGGVAKGYAVDRAVDALRAHGVAGAVVNAGGDLRVLGDEPVPIRIRDLDRGRLLDVGMLADGALATSTVFRERERAPAQSRSAIVDPRTSALVDHRRICSVLAPTCAVADGLTKVLAIAGTLEGMALRPFGAVPLVH